MQVPAGTPPCAQTDPTVGADSTRVDIEQTSSARSVRWQRPLMAVVAVAALIAGVATIDTDRRIETTDTAVESADGDVTSGEASSDEPTALEPTADALTDATTPGEPSVAPPTPDPTSATTTTPAAPSSILPTPAAPTSPPAAGGDGEPERPTTEPHSWTGRIFLEAEQQNGIYSIAVDGGDLRREIESDHAIRPRLSADGEWLYYMIVSVEPTIRPEIHRRNLAGVDEELLIGTTWWDGYQVSPDGRRLALVGEGKLHIADIESRSVRWIDVGTSQPWSVSNASWGPDSRRMLVSLPHGMVIVDVDSGEQHHVTDVVGEAEWSPDGTRAVFSGGWSGRAGLFVVELATGVVTTIGKISSDPRAPVGRMPAWSSDGTRVVYSLHIGGWNWQVREFSLPTGGDRLLLTNTLLRAHL